MRIIIPNTKGVDEAKRIVERSTEDLFRAAAGGIVPDFRRPEELVGKHHGIRIQSRGSVYCDTH